MTDYETWKARDGRRNKRASYAHRAIGALLAGAGLGQLTWASIMPWPTYFAEFLADLMGVSPLGMQSLLAEMVVTNGMLILGVFLLMSRPRSKPFVFADTVWSCFVLTFQAAVCSIWMAVAFVGNSVVVGALIAYSFRVDYGLIAISLMAVGITYVLWTAVIAAAVTAFGMAVAYRVDRAWPS